VDDCRLILGDCLDVLPTLAAGSVNAVVTDPPYNVGFTYAGNHDSRQDYAEWCLTWLAELQRICHGPVAVSIGQSNLSMWASIAPPDWWLAWWKPSAMGRCVVGFNNWEPIAVYGKPRKALCDVIRATINPDKDLDGHPCPKPLEWARKQVEMLSDPAETILDPFAGSGTTGVACLQTGRKFIGIEISPEYHAIARKRLAEVDGPLFAAAQPSLFTPAEEGAA
jgi:DNA modification methylase